MTLIHTKNWIYHIYLVLLVVLYLGVEKAKALSCEITNSDIQRAKEES
jgi:hypothetical protein